MGLSESWFTVDRKGLAKLLERRGLAFAVLELVQNAWDEPGVTEVDVTLEPVPGRPLVRLTVGDDAPAGFQRLSDAWTLFAESAKKGNPSQRGRFNLGEKLVLSLCEEATIVTTTGGVRFDIAGRHALRQRRERGSLVTLILRMTREQLAEVRAVAAMLIPPDTIRTVFDGQVLSSPTPAGRCEVVLPTELSDEDGFLRPSARKSAVTVYEAPSGGWLYEMGIPVVETGDRWHYDVGQKVPLTMDRQNVPPSFLRKVRAGVLNALADRLRDEDGAEGWVREAAASPECEPAAFASALTSRFGANRVIYDPSDPEANHRAVAAGYTLVRGNQLSAGERQNLQRFRDMGHQTLPPAGRVFPTRPTAKEPTLPERLTPGMERVCDYSAHVGTVLLGLPVSARVIEDREITVLASYGNRRVTFNAARLHPAFFDRTDADGLFSVHALLLHELAHESEGNHLADGYHDALCDLGAGLARALLDGSIRPRAYGFDVP
jgi:hypothetical protein